MNIDCAYYRRAISCSKNYIIVTRRFYFILEMLYKPQQYPLKCIVQCTRLV